jgi:hypothetical protein
MQNKQFQFGLVFFFLLAVSVLQVQTMYVRPITGAQSAYLITNIKKLTFSSGNLVVTPTSGAEVTHSLLGNRHINFADLTLSTPIQQQALTAFYVYPNPVKEVLHISKAELGQSIDAIAIIALDGRMVLEQKQINTNLPQVDVASLPQGMYLCKITSGSKTQNLKFLKQ